jgi:hypothetical protein
LYVGVSTTLEGLFVVGAGPPTPRVTVKYGTVQMDAIGAKVSGEGIVPDTRAAVEMFRLTEAQLQTNTGDDTIEVTFLTPVNYAVGGSISFNGVNQTTPNRPFVSSSGDTTVTPTNNPKVTVASAANEVVLDTVAQGFDAAGLAADVSQVEQWDGITCFGGFSSVGAGSTENGSTSTLMSWTQGDDGPWAIGAVSIIPLAPTEVELASFEAAQTGRGVRLRWQTGFEVNNLGFNLYREEKGARARVTPSIVAGSALMAGQGVRLTAGRSYSWLDKKGTADSEYWLESVDLDGRRTMHGPILPAPTNAGRNVPEENRSVLLDQLNAMTQDGSGASSAQNEYPASLIDAETVLKAEASEPFTSKGNSLESVDAVAEKPPERQRAIAAQAGAVKILVDHRGWYRVGQPELVAAGLSPYAVPQMLQLYEDGVQVPIIVNSSSALQFGTTASIEFYGTGLDTPWTNTRTYWLIAGTTPGERIQKTSARTLTRPDLNRPGDKPSNPAPNAPANPPAVRPGQGPVQNTGTVGNTGPVEITRPQPSTLLRRMLPLLLLHRDETPERPGVRLKPETMPVVPRSVLVEPVTAEPPAPTNAALAEPPAPAGAADAAPAERPARRKESKRKRRKRKASVKASTSRADSLRRLKSHAAMAAPLSNGAGGFAESFDYAIERAERTLYFAALQNGEAENFFGQLVGKEPALLKLNVHHLASATGQSTLEVSLQGVTTEAHEVRVNLNGVDVGQLDFVGQARPFKRFSVSNALLHKGENTLLLTALKGETDTSLVDRIGLTYAHAYEADNSTLTFSAQGRQSVVVDGFDNSRVRMLNITKPGQIEELLAPTEPTQAGYAVMFEMPQAGGTVLATTDSRIEHPAQVVRNQPTAWHRFKQGADLLILTHREFTNSLAPLADLRRSQGLSVAIVDVEDIYDEFSYGAHSTPALKDFLNWTGVYWLRVPRYVLLVGDCSLDPHNYLGQGQSDFVPTRLIDTAYLETASDDSLADFNNDGIPEMAVGRLPARTSAEATTIVGKVVAFQNSSLKRGALLVSDQNDGFDFEAANKEISALLPPTMAVENINRAGADTTQVRSQIINSVNQGPLVVNYLGHGSVEMWTGAGILRTADVGALTNKESLSFFVMMTCLNGFAQDVYTESLAEALLRFGNGGAAAVWASSGLTEPDEQAFMNQQLMRSLFNDKPATIGDAIISAKTATQNMDTRRTWMLFGDPTTRLR